MKKQIAGLVLFALAAFAAEEKLGSVTVTGNRVSLRAGPAITEVLLDRAMEGDELQLKDNSNAEWVGVVPPDTVDLWVHGDYIRDGAVVPEKLNVRSGPSLNHSVVGVLTNGQPVTVRGEVADWLRIAPADEATVWISRAYVSIVMPEPEVPVVAEQPQTNETAVAEIADEPAEPVVAVEETAVEEAEPEPEAAEVVTVTVLPFSETFEADSSKEQGIVDAFTGILKPDTGDWLYRLADAKVPDITLCYVRGNSAQMEAFSGYMIRLIGKTYWSADRDLPVIVPARIELLEP